MSLALNQTGPASFTVTEGGFDGSFTVTSSNTSVVTVTSPVAATSNTTTINLDAVAAGTANVTVTDGTNSVTVAVGVTTTGVIINTSHNHHNGGHQ